MKRLLALLLLSLSPLVAGEGVPGVLQLRTQPSPVVVYEMVDGQWHYVGWSDQALPFSDTLQPKLRFCYSPWVHFLGRPQFQQKIARSPEAYTVEERSFTKAELERGIQLPLGLGGWALFLFIQGGWILVPVLGGTGFALWRRRPRALESGSTAIDSTRTLGRFQLEKSLGKGGFGEVFLALDDQGKPAAVKVLRSEVAEDESARKRFFREIEVLSKLRHPNIVHIYDWGEADGRGYLCMEYLEGESLGDLLARGARLDRELLLRLLQDIGGALESVHQQGLVHRDVKPDNIFIESNGRFKLMDFGTAVSDDMTRATQTGMALGTPAYMAPEQIGGKLNPASDQYSLGVVAFLLLTGQKPFEAADPMALAWAHVHTPPPTPSEFQPELTKETDVVLLRMLAKQPQRRYATIREATAALIQSLCGHPLEEDSTMEFGGN